MKIEDIIFILENKIRTLEQLKSTATSNGDLEEVSSIEIQISENTNTLSTLKQK